MLVTDQVALNEPEIVYTRLCITFHNNESKMSLKSFILQRTLKDNEDRELL